MTNHIVDFSETPEGWRVSHMFVFAGPRWNFVLERRTLPLTQVHAYAPAPKAAFTEACRKAREHG